MTESPELLAKKARRDEKLYELQEKLHSLHQQQQSTTAGEPSSEQYRSYQHQDDDIEQGHIVLIDDDDANQQGRLLREQIKSLIHNEDTGRVAANGSVLGRMDAKQKALVTAVFVVLLYWWL